MKNLLNNLQPIFGKGQKLKAILIALFGLVIGTGGANYPVIMETVGSIFNADAPVHGVIVEQRLDPVFVIQAENGKLHNLLVPEGDLENFTIGSYYVERPEWVPPTIKPERTYKEAPPVEEIDQPAEFRKPPQGW